LASIPGKIESQRRFTQLPVSERRAILKAVNRGQQVGDRKHAAMAVWIARRQARFWKFAWLIGPVIAVVQFLLGSTPEQVLVNAGAATAFLLLLSAFWLRRARRAEMLNLAIAEGQKQRRRQPATPAAEESGPGMLDGLKSRFSRRGSTSGSSSTTSNRSAGTSRSGGHLPGESPGTTPRTTRPDTGSGRGAGQAPPPGQRPYKPRGRKRR
jgi:hypothetical protein